MSEEIKNVKIETVKENEDNPRYITDEKFEKLVASIKEFPDMMNKRPIIVDEDMVALGGNMRLKASKAAGLKTVPVIIAKGWSEEQKRQFIIKDNVGFGSWDWDLLGNTFDMEELADWGLDLPGMEIDEDGLIEGFDLPSGDKEPFESMTFKLADEQATQLKNALEDIKGKEEFKFIETFGNENGNGNALYLLVMEWVEQNK